MNQITTHVLDTSAGLPAEGVPILLQQPGGGADQWTDLYSGVTNSDGRAPGLVPEGAVLPPGIYRMRFDTGAYFRTRGIRGFYPYVTVVFELTDTSHYHIPLLLSPFGYSTYRGS